MNLIYNYHPETGECLGQATANVSPREPGVLLVPAFAAPLAPPAAGDRQCPCYLDATGKVPADYQDGTWCVVPDWRGVSLWSTTSGDPVAITAPGVTPEEIGATATERADPTTTWDGLGWVVDPALVADNLRERCDSRLVEINAERDRREESGFPYRGKVLDSTPRSVQRITAAALAAQAALAAGQQFQIDWTCADNSVLALDAAGVIGMPVALAQHAAALHAHARNLKAAVEAAMDSIAVAEIDIQAGWPRGEA